MLQATARPFPVGIGPPYFQFSHAGRLSAQQRQLLLDNTAAFIEQLDAEMSQRESGATGSDQPPAPSPPRTTVPAAAPTPPYRPPHRFYDAPDGEYEGERVLRWRWSQDRSCAPSTPVPRVDLDAIQARAALGLDPDLVLRCYAQSNHATPYYFALDVELRHFVPKKHTLRLLHQRGLIHQDQFTASQP